MDKASRITILTKAHKELGYRKEQAVFEIVRLQLFWPYLCADVCHYVQSCHQCQIHSIQRIEIPLIVSTLATLWIKIYVDIMLMPKAKGYKYIVVARDNLS